MTHGSGWWRTSLRMGLQLLSGLGVLMSCVVAGAQAPEAEVAKSLRVEWERSTAAWKRPSIEGYVYNDSSYRIGSVRLRVESLDGENRVVGERLAWVYGNINAGGRWYFSVPLPSGDAFRVTVESFHLVARETVRESP
jgi:hypothetical protein